MTEEALRELEQFCRKRHVEVDARLASGATTFALHDSRLTELEKDINNLCAKFLTMNARLNQILGSVVVACILLAINLMIGRL